MADFQIKDGVLVKYVGTDEEVVIPEGVTAIGNDAIAPSASRMKRVVIPKGVTSIGERAFYSCTALESVVLPEGLVSIADDAFFYCLNLKEIRFPASLKTIGAHAFEQSGLEHLAITASVTSIEACAFASCENLTDAKLPKRFKGGLFKKGLKNIFVGPFVEPDKNSKYYEDQLKTAQKEYNRSMEIYRKIAITLY